MIALSIPAWSALVSRLNPKWLRLFGIVGNLRGKSSGFQALKAKVLLFFVQVRKRFLCFPKSGLTKCSGIPDNHFISSYQSVNQSINQSISQSINQLINQSTNQPTNYSISRILAVYVKFLRFLWPTPSEWNTKSNFLCNMRQIFVAVDGRIWDQVIELYPRLVECSVCNSTQVRRALREALQEYADLLRPPTHTSTINGDR